MAKVVWEEVEQEGAVYELRLYAALRSQEAGLSDYSGGTGVKWE
jgi:hypothetical protein